MNAILIKSKKYDYDYLKTEVYLNIRWLPVSYYWAMEQEQNSNHDDL